MARAIDSKIARHERLKPLLLTLAAACQWALGCGGPSERPVRSTVLIVVDTLRADHLSHYGYGRETSPEFDRWAERAAVFDRAIASSSWTLPSFASIYTGQHPQLHGAGEILEGEGLKIAGIEKDIPTVAELLQNAGFATVAYANNPFLHEKFGVARGFRDYFFVPASNTDIRSATKTVDLALAWIDDHLRDHPEQPFFAVIHLFDPHMDYAPKAPFRGRFAGDYVGPLSFPVSQGAKMRKGNLPMTDADREYVAASYDEEIAYTDQQVGRLLSGLDSRGLLQRASVILTSDHGEELFDHGSFEHGHTGYQELLHVPLAIWGPGVEARNIAEPVSHIDLFSTILESAGLDSAIELPSQSLLAAAEGRGVSGERPILADRTLHGRRHRVLIRWPYKAIDIEGQTGGMLFHLERDPGETRNLIDSERGRFDAMMAEFEKQSPTPDREERNREAAVLDDAIRAQLESLGYATPADLPPVETPSPIEAKEEDRPGRWVHPGG